MREHAATSKTPQLVLDADRLEASCGINRLVLTAAQARALEILSSGQPVQGEFLAAELDIARPAAHQLCVSLRRKFAQAGIPAALELRRWGRLRRKRTPEDHPAALAAN